MQPTTFDDLLGTLKSKQGEADINSVKEAEIVCLYFTSNWSPPCKRFTPILIDFYKEINLDPTHPKLEIVFVSSDKTEEEYTRYYEEMPWLAMQFGDVTKSNQLRTRYNVEQIPTLIVLNKECELVTKNGRADIMKDGENAFVNWGGSP